MSNGACRNLNKNNKLRLHDSWPNPNCKCQKRITFTLKQFQMEGACFKNGKEKIFKGSQKACNFF